jgi:DNA polymerase III gamma/tau subunit
MKNILKIFKEIQLKKDIKKNFFLINNNKSNIFLIKKIFVWMLCKKRKEKKICRKCNSCINFLKNNHCDYIEIIIDNDTVLNSNLIEKNIKIRPIISKIKVFLFFFNVEKEFLIKKIIYLTSKMNNIISIIIIKDKYKLSKNAISFKIIKYLYKLFSDNNEYNIYKTEINNMDKTIILNSIIFFLKEFFSKTKVNNNKHKVLKTIIRKYKKHIQNIRNILNLMIFLKNNTLFSINKLIMLLEEFVKKTNFFHQKKI